LLFFSCVAAGLFLVVTWFIERFVWRNKRSKMSGMSQEEKIKEIKELLDSLK
jgi:hypothetical protein